jgi:hypothetical protein
VRLFESLSGWLTVAMVRGSILCLVFLAFWQTFPLFHEILHLVVTFELPFTDSHLCIHSGPLMVEDFQTANNPQTWPFSLTTTV